MGEAVAEESDAQVALKLAAHEYAMSFQQTPRQAVRSNGSTLNLHRRPSTTS